jgi:isopentenyl phosphate kinase
MTTFIKFGGSVITDKRIAESADHAAIARMPLPLPLPVHAIPNCG